MQRNGGNQRPSILKQITSGLVHPTGSGVRDIKTVPMFERQNDAPTRTRINQSRPPPDPWTRGPHAIVAGQNLFGTSGPRQRYTTAITTGVPDEVRIAPARSTQLKVLFHHISAR